MNIVFLTRPHGPGRESDELGPRCHFAEPGCLAGGKKGPCGSRRRSLLSLVLVWHWAWACLGVALQRNSIRGRVSHGPLGWVKRRRQGTQAKPQAALGFRTCARWELDIFLELGVSLEAPRRTAADLQGPPSGAKDRSSRRQQRHMQVRRVSTSVTVVAPRRLPTHKN